MASAGSASVRLGADGEVIDGDMSASIAALESLLGYSFRNPRLAEEALTHPSAQRNNMSYQRLEFLGDAALGLAVAIHLFLTNPGEGPGRLTLLRSANISTEKLARVAVRHGLYAHLRCSAPTLDVLVEDFAAAAAFEEDVDATLAAIYGGATMRAPKVLADMVESVAGAVFVDSDYNLAAMWHACKEFLQPIISAETFHDQPVTVLTKLCQKRGWSLGFKSWREGDKTVANAIVNGQLLGTGLSDQKSISKLNAAREALREISRIIMKDSAEAMEIEKEEDKELGSELGSAASVVMVSSDQKVTDGSEETGISGSGNLVVLKDANEAKKRETEDCEMNDGFVVVAEGEIYGRDGEFMRSSGMEEEEVEEAKVKLNTICGKKHWPNPVYSVDRELGPAHDKKFICSVRLETPEGTFAVSGGIRSRKKNAENAAASKLLEALRCEIAKKLRS